MCRGRDVRGIRGRGGDIRAGESSLDGDGRSGENQDPAGEEWDKEEKEEEEEEEMEERVIQLC